MDPQVNLPTTARTNWDENEKPTSKQPTVKGLRKPGGNLNEALGESPTISIPIAPDMKESDSVVVSCTMKDRSDSWTSTPASRTSSWKLLLSPSFKVQDDTQWGVHYFMPMSMCLLGIAGICGAVVHHVYNKSLDGEPIRDAEWPQRFGLALAFFTKMCLIAAVEIAYKQQSWRVVQKRALRIETIDAMFSAGYDPMQFFNFELLLKATIPTILAGLIWLLPLCAIASPSSLTSATSIINATTICNNIPTLDFSRENHYGLDTVGDTQQALSYWDFKADNKTFYFAGPSMDLQRIAKVSLLSRKGPLQPSNPCPREKNCSYSISFDGPAYRCEEKPDFDSYVPMSKGRLAPGGNYTYFGYSSASEDASGRPKEWVNTTDDKVGVFHEEPPLWIGYVINTTEPDTSSHRSIWPHKLDPKVMKCTLYSAKYTYTMSFLNGIMSVNNSQTDYKTPLLEPKATMSPNASNYMSFAGLHATGFLFRKTMDNAINQSGEASWSETYSDISQTTLVVPDNSDLAVADFPAAVERKFADLILSLMSDPIMHSQTIAAIPCTVASTVLLWSYDPRWLLLSYGLGILVTLVAVAVGAVAFVQNGYAVDMCFSTLLATTRGKDLDELARGSCLGQFPLGEAFMRNRLQFGEVMGGDARVRHAGFGFPGKIESTKFGEKYE